MLSWNDIFTCLILFMIYDIPWKDFGLLWLYSHIGTFLKPCLKVTLKWVGNRVFSEKCRALWYQLSIQKFSALCRNQDFNFWHIKERTLFCGFTSKQHEYIGMNFGLQVQSWHSSRKGRPYEIYKPSEVIGACIQELQYLERQQYVKLCNFNHHTFSVSYFPWVGSPYLSQLDPLFNLTRLNIKVLAWSHSHLEAGIRNIRLPNPFGLLATLTYLQLYD